MSDIFGNQKVLISCTISRGLMDHVQENLQMPNSNNYIVVKDHYSQLMTYLWLCALPILYLLVICLLEAIVNFQTTTRRHMLEKHIVHCFRTCSLAVSLWRELLCSCKEAACFCRISVCALSCAFWEPNCFCCSFRRFVSVCRAAFWGGHSCIMLID